MGNSLISAARDGDLSKVRQICEEKKMDVNYQDGEHGVTALMEASHQGHGEVVQYLVDHNANVNLTSKHGVPAVVYAATMNNFDIVEYLVSRGADTRPVGFIKKEINYDFPAVNQAIRRGAEAKNKGTKTRLETGETGTPAQSKKADAQKEEQARAQAAIEEASQHGISPELAAMTASMSLGNDTPPPGKRRARKHSVMAKKMGSPAAPATPSTPATPNKTELKNTTNMLKGEVAKLKEFLKQAAEQDAKLEKLEKELAESQSALRSARAENQELTETVRHLLDSNTVQRERRPSETAMEMEWVKEKANLTDSNAKLMEQVKLLTKELGNARLELAAIKEMEQAYQDEEEYTGEEYTDEERVDE